jgi:hypothetical protein
VRRAAVYVAVGGRAVDQAGKGIITGDIFLNCLFRRTVVYGCTELLNADRFIDQLTELE